MRMKNPQFTLQTPGDEELIRVEPLLDLMETEMANSGGYLSFERFMEIALYADALGYYTGKNVIFGEEGDFITAPEMSPLFSRCIARQVQQVLVGLGIAADVLEFGAGAGRMVADILLELENLEALPRTYYIVEISPSLQQRQRAHIATEAPHLLQRVQWVNKMPEEFVGIVLGNEILDAIPTHRVRINPDGKHQELFVTVKDNRFAWLTAAFSDPALENYCQNIFEKYGDSFAGSYDTEVNLQSLKWIEELAGKLKQGVILLIDYGYSDKEFYRPERHEGTLMCHYKHLAHGDALIHVGLQDITSHVNFTHVAEAAFASDIDVLGFTSQMYFLIACGLEGLLAEIDISDAALFINETRPVKQLILPDEMGELFKVVAFGREFDPPLLGFSMNNQMERL